MLQRCRETKQISICSIFHDFKIYQYSIHTFDTNDWLHNFFQFPCNIDTILVHKRMNGLLNQ